MDGGLKTIKTNHENTKFRKHEIYFYFSFFVFLIFRAFVMNDRTHEQ
jgi:hypothetical protein